MLRKNKKDKRARALTAAFVAPLDDEEDELPFHSSPPVDHLQSKTNVKLIAMLIKSKLDLKFAQRTRIFIFNSAFKI